MTKPTNVSTIVLVDDEPEILFSTAVMLRRAGFGEIKTMQDSRELLDYLCQREVGVVVLDLQMPHRSGKELLAELACSYPDLPVIIVTAANELDTVDEIVVHCHFGGRSAKAVEFLRKAGFKKVKNLAGGIDAWSQDVDPSCPRY